jgi:hypothetical protein
MERIKKLIALHISISLFISLIPGRALAAGATAPVVVRPLPHTFTTEIGALSPDQKAIFLSELNTRLSALGTVPSQLTDLHHTRLEALKTATAGENLTSSDPRQLAKAAIVGALLSPAISQSVQGLIQSSAHSADSSQHQSLAEDLRAVVNKYGVDFSAIDDSEEKEAFAKVIPGAHIFDGAQKGSTAVRQACAAALTQAQRLQRGAPSTDTFSQEARP